MTLTPSSFSMWSPILNLEKICNSFNQYSSKTYLNMWNFIYDASFLDSLDERITSLKIYSISIKAEVVTIFKVLTPLSVIVSPSASSALMISISFGRPFLCAKMKSSSPICPPRSFDISTLCELSVQKRIYEKC